MLIIIIHELGHYITGYLLGLNVSEIRIFMFGGVTKLKEGLNLSIFKEILMIIMGPVTQILFWLFVSFLYRHGYVGLYTYQKINYINKILLSFNLLPIIPLDGGKLLNNILDLFFSYEMSHKVSVFISVLFIPFVFAFDTKLFAVLFCLFLILNVFEEIKIHKYRLNKLLLERKLGNIKFKRIINIYDINDVRRGYGFRINMNDIFIDETDFYRKYFLQLGT